MQLAQEKQLLVLLPHKNLEHQLLFQQLAPWKNQMVKLVNKLKEKENVKLG
jgi:hypothetical protein